MSIRARMTVQAVFVAVVAVASLGLLAGWQVRSRQDAVLSEKGLAARQSVEAVVSLLQADAELAMREGPQADAAQLRALATVRALHPMQGQAPFLMNAQGTLLEPARPAPDAPQLLEAARFANGGFVVGAHQQATYVKRVPGTPWLVGTVIELEPVHEAFRRELLQLGVALALAVGLVLVLMMSLARTVRRELARPSVVLAGAMAAMAPRPSHPSHPPHRHAA